MRQSSSPRPSKRLRYILQLSAAVLLLTGCVSKEEAAAAFYTQGIAHYQNARYEKARLEFLNAVQRDPQHADAYFHLGLIAKREGDIALVFEHMSLAMQLDPGHLDAKIHVAELYVYGQRFEDALKLAGQIEALAAGAHAAQRIEAAALVGLKEYGKAKKIIQLALQQQADNASLHGLLAVIAKEQNDVQGALLHLNRAIELSAQKTQYLTLRASIHRDLNDLGALEQDYRLLLAQRPDSEDYLFPLARLLLQDQRAVEAEQLIEAFVAAHPHNVATKQFYIELLLQRDENKAQALLDEYIRRDSAATELQFFRINLHVKNNRLSAAQNELNSIASGHGDDNRAQLKANAMRAELLLRQSQASEAMALLQANLARDNRHEHSHLVLAGHSLQQRDFDTAVASLRTVLRHNPASEQGLVLLGKVYLASGSELLADDAFRQALEHNPANAEAAMPVVRKLVAAQDLARAQNIIARVLRSKPKDAKLLMFQAQIHLLNQDWADAAVTIARLQNLPGSEAYAEFLRGRVWQGQDNCARAVTHYQRALAGNPNLVPAVQGISVCYLALGKEKELLEFLSAYQQQNPHLIHGHLAIARIHKSRGRLPQAVAKLKRALRTKPQWVNGYITMAAYQDELGEQKAAIDTYQKGIRLNREHIPLKIALAGYHQANNRFAEAAALYQKILQQDGDNLLAINNYAALLLDSNPTTQDQARALSLAEKLKHQTLPHYLDTYGWALFHNGRYAEAEEVLRRAAEAGNNIPAIQYHFGMALTQLQRTEEAKVVFKRALKQDSLNGDIKFALEKALANL